MKRFTVFYAIAYALALWIFGCERPPTEVETMPRVFSMDAGFRSEPRNQHAGHSLTVDVPPVVIPTNPRVLEAVQAAVWKCPEARNREVVVRAFPVEFDNAVLPGPLILRVTWGTVGGAYFVAEFDVGFGIELQLSANTVETYFVNECSFNPVSLPQSSIKAQSEIGFGQAGERARRHTRTMYVTAIQQGCLDVPIVAGGLHNWIGYAGAPGNLWPSTIPPLAKAVRIHTVRTVAPIQQCAQYTVIFSTGVGLVNVAAQTVFSGSDIEIAIPNGAYDMSVTNNDAVPCKVIPEFILEI